MTVEASEVKAAREALGWTRPEALKRLDAPGLTLTLAKLARMESTGPRGDAEHDLARELLQRAGLADPDRVPEDPESPSDGPAGLPDPPTASKPTDDFDTGKLVETEWRGLRRGDVVRVDGESGRRFKFDAYVKTPVQEYVSLYSLKNGGNRCVRPERIRTNRGKVPTLANRIQKENDDGD